MQQGWGVAGYSMIEVEIARVLGQLGTGCRLSGRPFVKAAEWNIDPQALRGSDMPDRVKGDTAGDRWLIGQLKHRPSALAGVRWIIGQLMHRSAASAAYF
eukprot:16448487-Heterocapsa_arctica.AAC.1